MNTRMIESREGKVVSAVLFCTLLAMAACSFAAPEMRMEGDGASHAGGAGEPERIRVLVWNIFRAGNEVENGPEKILAFIRKVEADICLLQESYDIKGNRPKAGAWLAGELGWNQYQGGSSHLSVLTHFPLANTALLPNHKANGAGIDLGEGRTIMAFSSWIDWKKPVWDGVAQNPNASAKELLKHETEYSSRLVHTQGILRGLRDLGYLSGKVPLLVGGDWNSPSHLDWTEEAEKYMTRKRNLPLPASLLMEKAGFEDCFRVMHPDPVAVPGPTYNPHYGTGPSRYRMDRLYMKNPEKGFKLVPVMARSLPVEAEWGKGKVIPLKERKWPSDHGAVLVEFEIRSIPCESLGIVSNEEASMEKGGSQ